MSLLENIEQPSDLRGLSYDELEQLSSEIRLFLLEAISKTGGHLSSNLGVVELTLALHRVFDSPRDRLIWDVGHQAYVHKLVTGRRGFSGLRGFGGLSGYPSRAESPHDFVENSHASTSLSYALGHALTEPEYWTVAIIGDGALTGGMAYEALSHIAVTRPKRLIVIVNDNGRSYAPTVGGFATLANLAHYRFDRRYEWAKKTTGKVLRGLPLVGEMADEFALRFKEAVKQLVDPSTVFDILDLKYSGRIDGHDIPLLEETLTRAKEFDEPVVIHVVTEKGSGYQPAIDDQVEKLHGVGRFDLATGRPLSSELKYTDVVGAALLDAARRMPDLVGVSAAMISSTGLAEMAEEFPDRVIDTGIAEQHAVTMAAGMAMAGKRPVVAIYSSFLQRAFDQVAMDVSLHKLPVVFLIDRAGVTGPDGPSHHGGLDLGYLRMIPNMVVGAPADAEELCGMLETALHHDGPIAIRYPKAPASALPDLPAVAIPIGVWEGKSTGEDVLFLAAGRLVESAEKAAATLAQEGISCSVVNARWIKPLDTRLSDWVRAHKLTVTIEDNAAAGGFGAAVLESLSGAGLAGKVRIIGLPDSFLPAGSSASVIRAMGLDIDSIVATARAHFAAL